MTKIKDGQNSPANTQQIIVASSIFMTYNNIHLCDVFSEVLIIPLQIILQFVVLLSPLFFCVKG